MIFRRNLLMNRKSLGLVDSDDTNGRLSQFFFRKIYSSLCNKVYIPTFAGSSSANGVPGVGF